MYEFYDMRHTGFRMLTVVNGPSGFGLSQIEIQIATQDDLNPGSLTKPSSNTEFNINIMLRNKLFNHSSSYHEYKIRRQLLCVHHQHILLVQ